MRGEGGATMSKVLVIDDQEAVRMAVKVLLELNDLAVVTAWKAVARL